MNSSFINQLFDLLLSPVGIVGCFLGLFIVIQAQRSRPFSWALFSLYCFCASLAKHHSQYVLEPPALVFPLQQLRDFGRPLTIVLLGLLLLLALTQHRSWRRHLLAEPIRYLIVVQAVILFKVLSQGSISFALIAAATFAAVIYVLVSGPSTWLTDNQNFRQCVYSIIGACGIFLTANFYQGIFNLQAITFLHGRLSGTTGNPQHAAVLLAATIPCVMFTIETSSQKWQKTLGVIFLCAVGIGLFMTGSRTGLLMAITTVFFFYRNRSQSLIRLAIAVTIALSVILLVTHGGESILSDNSSVVASRFSSVQNTRGGAWAGMWKGLSSHPLLGVPITGDRVGFGESAWLGAGSTLGLAGLIPLLLFTASCLKMMFRLSAMGKRSPQYYFHCSTVVAGLACLLVGSFFEAFLLGNLSFSLLATLTYLSLGQYLVECQQFQQFKADRAALSEPHLSLADSYPRTPFI